MEDRKMTKILKNMIFAATVLLAASCSLKEEPTSFVNKHNFYKTKDQCYAALNVCYAQFNNIYKANFMIAIEGCTDLWHSKSSSGDASLDISPSKPQFGATVWEQCYKGIKNCNEAIVNIDMAPLDESVKKPLAAEGRVVRAMYYYILTSMFDGVPFYTCMVDSYHVQDSIRALPRTPADTVRARLYRDLRDNAIPYFTEENGLKVRGGDAKDNRSGYAHGLMLMAKMAMWNACSQDKDAPKDPAYSEEWFRNALVPLNALEELYGELTEENYPLEQTCWKYKNVAESIFEIQHEYSSDGVRYHADVASIMMPKYDRVNDLFDGVRFENYTKTLPGWEGLRTNNYFAVFRNASGKEDVENLSQLSLFSPLPLSYDLQKKEYKFDLDALKKGQKADGRKIDRRLQYVLGLGNSDSGEVFTQTKKYGIAWAGPKFWCTDITNTYDSNNYRIFRYADAVLMKAEALAELGDLTCVDYLNQVRARAGVDDYEFVDYPEFLQFVRDERARELGGEFMRKFDLVRWGIWYEQTLKHIKGGKDLLVKPYHRYYPIPDKQCALAGYDVLDNPEYKNAGLK